MTPNGSPAGQAGEFTEGFVFALFWRLFGRIVKREHTGDHQIAESVRDLGDLISLVDLFKKIHNIAQNFINDKSAVLFSDDAHHSFKDDEDIKEAWTNHYKGDFEHKILTFNRIIVQLDKKAKKIGYVEAVAETQYGHIQERIANLTEDVPAAIERAKELIKQIKKHANTALKRKVLARDLSRWNNGELKKPAEALAHEVLRDADAVLVDLIDILSFLYDRICPSK